MRHRLSRNDMQALRKKEFSIETLSRYSFATTEGETYTITNLSEKVTVDAPSALTLTDGTKLSWKASPDAASYRVYRAVNSQASYELVAENITDTSFTYVPTDLEEGDQMTMRVTAVDANGYESKGVTILGFN